MCKKYSVHCEAYRWIHVKCTVYSYKRIKEPFPFVRYFLQPTHTNTHSHTKEKQDKQTMINIENASKIHHLVLNLGQLMQCNQPCRATPNHTKTSSYQQPTTWHNPTFTSSSTCTFTCFCTFNLYIVYCICMKKKILFVLISKFRIWKKNPNQTKRKNLPFDFKFSLVFIYFRSRI